MRLAFVLLCIAVPFGVLAIAAVPAEAQSTATYRVTFEATWSAETHPEDFPAGAHFSSLVGATHDATAVLWEPGGLASEGIEAMAELGTTGTLAAEVEALIASGQAEFVLLGGNVPSSPGSVDLTFDVSEAFSRVTLVSMVAPSPDWFVGTNGLDLHEGGTWAPEVVFPLYAYDAGTDSGTSYTAPDEDTVPPEPIAQITWSPFLVNGDVPPVGSYTFTLLSVTAAEEAPDATGFVLDAPFPNPAAGPATLPLRLADPHELRVEVFDALGRRVAALHDGVLPAGTHALTLDTDSLPGGVYVVRVTGDGGTATRRVVVR